MQAKQKEQAKSNSKSLGRRNIVEVIADIAMRGGFGARYRTCQVQFLFKNRPVCAAGIKTL